tara:strand:- start:5708 stop:6250 length:543 start_codon:yes stop_codon:yes gene_type:complete
MKRLQTIAFASSLALALGACQETEEAPADTVAVPTGVTTLPVSINAAMVGLIDQSADYLWAMGNGDLPKDAHDWDQVRAASYDMIIGGAVIQIPGTGEHDAEWVKAEDWRTWSNELTKIGEDALPLAEEQSTDVDEWRALGNRLIDNCEACHAAYKPEIPSQGILHEEISRDAEGVSIFD